MLFPLNLNLPASHVEGHQRVSENSGEIPTIPYIHTNLVNLWGILPDRNSTFESCLLGLLIHILWWFHVVPIRNHMKCNYAMTKLGCTLQDISRFSNVQIELHYITLLESH